MNLSRVIMYNGVNLQAKNSKGACVGFASNFLKLAGGVLLKTETFNKNVSNALLANSNDPNVVFKNMIKIEEGRLPEVPRSNTKAGLRVRR